MVHSRGLCTPGPLHPAPIWVMITSSMPQCFCQGIIDSILRPSLIVLSYYRVARPCFSDALAWHISVEASESLMPIRIAPKGSPETAPRKSAPPLAKVWAGI